MTPGPLDHDAAARGARESRDQGNRRGQDQRAGRGDHQHRHGAYRIAAGGPRETGDRQRYREQHHGVAVGHAQERCPLGLRLADEPDHAGVGALGGRPLGAQLERGAGVDRPTADRPTRRDAHGQGLPGEGRLVDDRGPGGQRAVHRHNLARADHDHVADPQALDRDLFERAANPAMCDAGRALDQRRQLPPGPPCRRLLERVAPREHEPDHGGGEVLAYGEGRGHRDQGDEVDPQPPPPEHPHDRPRERHEHHDGPCRPGGVAQARPPRQVERAAQDDGGQRSDHEKPVDQLGVPTGRRAPPSTVRSSTAARVVLPPRVPASRAPGFSLPGPAPLQEW